LMGSSDIFSIFFDSFSGTYTSVRVFLENFLEPPFLPLYARCRKIVKMLKNIILRLPAPILSLYKVGMFSRKLATLAYTHCYARSDSTSSYSTHPSNDLSVFKLPVSQMPSKKETSSISTYLSLINFVPTRLIWTGIGRKSRYRLYLKILANIALKLIRKLAKYGFLTSKKYGLWSITELWGFSMAPYWWTPKIYGFHRLWVMVAMGYDSFDCSTKLLAHLPVSSIGCFRHPDLRPNLGPNFGPSLARSWNLK
jgi:hypothetical protein